MSEIDCPLAKASLRWPEHPAFIDSDMVVTYREFNLRVDVVMESLRREGISEGYMVGILADNCLSYVLLLYALWRLGAVACPVNTRLPAANVAGLLGAIGCNLLVTVNNLAGEGYPTSVRQLDMRRLTATRPSERWFEYKPFKVDLNRAATVIFTSGTTSKPKAVLHSYGNHYYSALGSNENIRVLPGDRWLLSLPLYHVGGLAILFRVALGGGTVVIDSGNNQLSETIEYCQITHLSLVAAQLRRLLKEGLSSSASEWLRATLVGGQAVPKQLVSEAVGRGWPIFTTYGLTEMASQVTTSAPDDPPARRATSGRLLPHRQLRIADDGEVFVRGETLFQRYLGVDDSSRQTDSDGWYHTGDIGSLDEDGYLTVTGRRDNMFVSGGENIYPEEIEAYLAECPGILEALVVPRADKEFGYRPVAFLKLGSSASYTDDDVIAHLRKLLPGFKIPICLLHWPEIDDHGEMKPDRQRFQRLVDAGNVVEIS